MCDVDSFGKESHLLPSNFSVEMGWGWHRMDLWVEWAQQSREWRKGRACLGKLCSHGRHARREGSGGDTVQLQV